VVYGRRAFAMRFLVPLAASLLLAFAAGCGIAGEQIGKGIGAYERGDYPAAMNAWNELNGLENEMGDKTRTRYLIYRGLTYYALGVRRYALMYLSRGKREYVEHDYSFLPDDHAQMVDRALNDLLHNEP
jgi:hypothetical protein